MTYLKSMAACAALVLMSALSFAQDGVADKKKEINSIKKNSSYIYAEATLADRQAAIDLAKEILYKNINEWVDKQKKFASVSSVVTVNANYEIEDVTLPRGNWFRAFMYVKKTDIIPANNVEVTETPGASEKRMEDTEATTVHTETGLAPDLLEAFLATTNTGQLAVMLREQKAQGRVLEYNKLNALASPEQYVLFIFSQDGNIRAVLSAGTERRNLKTGSHDQVSNYKGHGAIGVKVNSNK